MAAKQITPNLIQVTRQHFVNAFLVREDDGFTLVDTTTGGGADAFIAAASDAGGEIRRVALTHGHADHVGSLDALREKLGDGVEVSMPELDAKIHAGEEFADEKPPGGWPEIATVPDVRLKAGDRVGSLEVMATPGHTPGHVSFLDARDGTVIAGDALTSYGKVQVPTFLYWRFPLAATATWDKAKAVESARQIRDRDPKTLVVGHGPAVSDPAEAIDAAIARAS